MTVTAGDLRVTEVSIYTIQQSMTFCASLDTMSHNHYHNYEHLIIYLGLGYIFIFIAIFGGHDEWFYMSNFF